ncbi:hypothetical protein GH714_027115 [Hevea brasiliensis]|uniref:Agglutinin domain-containing protein n=1 Tax=Hevea brasiliensis TaxID=3981 RepID=A0A6A6M963_HEVBR|nr:hypothetical protein GH714_027115 [Hevea brasiliensis]
MPEEEVFSPFAKIEVETAKINTRFVHLRFCSNNKYWARLGADRNDIWIVAKADQPEEDMSKWSCTLFEPTLGNDGFLYFRHVQTGKRVRTNGVGSWDITSRVYVDYSDNGDSTPWYAFTFVDWDTLVIMPKYVTFKGYNDKYLRAGWIERHEYHQFSSDDGNKEETGYEVIMNPDGRLRIKSKFFNKFWRRSPNWIWADSTDTTSNNIDTLFWPVKVNDNTIALATRNAGNNRFCSSLTTEGKIDCLNAAVSTITTPARLQVEELVFERQINNVIFRMEDARIFDERAVVAGIGSGVNDSPHESLIRVTVSFEDTSSYTFSNSLSIMAGVTTSIQTGFARIVEGKIEVTAEVTTSLEWNRTTTETRKAEATYQAVVPPMTRVTIDYVATQGTCNVPFSYTQRDKLSHDGSSLTTQRLTVHTLVSITTASTFGKLTSKLIR